MLLLTWARYSDCTSVAEILVVVYSVHLLPAQLATGGSAASKSGKCRVRLVAWQAAGLVAVEVRAVYLIDSSYTSLSATIAKATKCPFYIMS